MTTDAGHPRRPPRGVARVQLVAHTKRMRDMDAFTAFHSPPRAPLHAAADAPGGSGPAGDAPGGGTAGGGQAPAWAAGALPSSPPRRRGPSPPRGAGGSPTPGPAELAPSRASQPPPPTPAYGAPTWLRCYKGTNPAGGGAPGTLSPAGPNAAPPAPPGWGLADNTGGATTRAATATAAATAAVAAAALLRRDPRTSTTFAPGASAVSRAMAGAAAVIEDAGLSPLVAQAARVGQPVRPGALRGEEAGAAPLAPLMWWVREG
jgi:hypothetical protein